jgi:RNA 2',3'-cyclic 3'-phosphodiesterase
MIRAFAALEIPNEIKNKIVNFRKSIISGKDDFRWEPAEKIHLTLKFIGDVDDSKVPDIINAISFVENYQSFNFNLTRFGFFFNNNKPKILWIGLSENERLSSLVDDLNSKLSRLSILAEKRKFKSHLTILRIKNNFPQHLIDKFKNFNIPQTSFASGKISLIKSELLSIGSKYTIIKNFELSPRALGQNKMEE